MTVTEPDQLVSYLSSLTLNESRAEAVEWILKAWGLDAAGVSLAESDGLEGLEESHGLSSFELSGNFKRLTTLNYPAILEVALPQSLGTKYLALISTDGQRGVFGSVDRIDMSLTTINPLWTRKAILLWKDFEGLPKTLERGWNGREAIWLQKNLRLLGFFKGREAPFYGEQTEQAVLKFQRKFNIKDDGRFQTDSKMLLYNLLKIYPTPKLIQP